MTIDELREGIDRLDDELLAIFNRRASLALEIGAIKKEGGLAVYDPSREQSKDLVNAFRATLEELDDADLLLHVIDASDSAHEEQIAAVERILRDLKLDPKPRLLVFNKADRLPPGQADEIAAGYSGLAISARSATSTVELLRQIERLLWEEGRTSALPSTSDGADPEAA